MRRTDATGCGGSDGHACGAYRRRGSYPPEPLEARRLLATFTVSTPADSGPGSLRQAILDANASPGTDNIVVDLGGDRTVRPTSALPAITDHVNFAGLMTLNGELAGPSADGLVFSVPIAGRSEVREPVAVVGFGGSGVVVNTAGEVILRYGAVGTDPTGTLALGNGRGPGEAAGIKVLSGRVEVGRDAAQGTGATPFFVSANDGDGIAVHGGSAVVYYARVGGDGPLGNTGHGASARGGGGVSFFGPGPLTGYRIGITVAGNGGDGVRATGANSVTGLTGVTVRDNAGAGVRWADGALAVLRSSVVRNNRGAGLSIEGGVNGSVLGVTVTANGGHGVAILPGSRGNTIRGEPWNRPAAPNHITGNGGSGIYVEGPGTVGNIVNSNYVGAPGNGNAGDGITIVNADGNWMGWGASSSIIRDNGGNGVTIRGSRGYNFAYDLVHDNRGIGVDLGGDGPTANDPLDADEGANGLQNHPVIASAVREGTVLTVTGSLHTTPLTAAAVVVYADFPLAGTAAQSRRILGTVNVTTDAAGNTPFTLRATQDAPAAGAVVTARAITPPHAQEGSSTSEFSPGVVVQGDGRPPRVAMAYVKGGNWSAPFLQHLEDWGMGSRTHGFALDRLNLGAAGVTLPWAGLNDVTILFDQPVGYAARIEVRDSQGPVPGVFGMTGGNWVAWRLGRPLSGRVTVTVDDESANANGPLDGEYAVNYPSGDGAPRGDFVLPFNVLPGDVNRDGRVTVVDFGQVRARQMKTTAMATDPQDPRAYNAFHDVNGSGRIDLLDLRETRLRQRSTLPPAASVTRAVLSDA
jgi:hypothetical protein